MSTDESGADKTRTPPTHRAPSPGQSMCTCRAQAIELVYALEVARVAAEQKGGRS